MEDSLPGLFTGDRRVSRAVKASTTVSVASKPRILTAVRKSNKAYLPHHAEPPSNSAPLLRLVHAARSELCDPHLSRALVLVDGAMRRRRCSLRASPRGSPWTAASCRWISALSQRRRNAHESGRRCNCVLCGIGCRSIETACAALCACVRTSVAVV